MPLVRPYGGRSAGLAVLMEERLLPLRSHFEPAADVSAPGRTDRQYEIRQSPWRYHPLVGPGARGQDHGISLKTEGRRLISWRTGAGNTDRRSLIRSPCRR